MSLLSPGIKQDRLCYVIFSRVPVPIQRIPELKAWQPPAHDTSRMHIFPPNTFSNNWVGGAMLCLGWWMTAITHACWIAALMVIPSKIKGRKFYESRGLIHASNGEKNCDELVCSTLTALSFILRSFFLLHFFLLFFSTCTARALI